jgi:hypothetical protein
LAKDSDLEITTEILFNGLPRITSKGMGFETGTGRQSFKALFKSISNS